MRGLRWILAGLWLVGCMAWALSTSESEPEPATAVQAAQDAPRQPYLKHPDSDASVPVAFSESDLDLSYEMARSGDHDGIRFLQLQDRTALILSGTPVEVVRLGFTKSQVRLQGMMHKGQVAWVLTENIQDY